MPWRDRAPELEEIALKFIVRCVFLLAVLFSAGVQAAFDIPERYVPVLTLAVGRAAEGNWPRKPRSA